jgi:glycogen synthase
MKIVFLTSLYPPVYFGGYELECRDIADGLRSRGHEVTVVASMCGLDSAQVDGHVHRVMKFWPDVVPPGMLSPKRRNPAPYLQGLWRFHTLATHNAREFARILDDVRPDVASIWVMSSISMTPLQELSDRGVPRVHRIATPWPLEALKYHLPASGVRRVLRRLSTGLRDPRKCLTEGLFVVVTDFIGRQLIENGIPPDQVSTVFPHAHVPKEIEPLYDGQVFRMLYAGRVCEEKGVHLVIRAAGELTKIAPDAEFSLDIVGDGEEDYLARLEQEARDLGLAGRVHFTGKVPREQLEKMRSQYHALVFAPIWPEPAAGILIETMAYGLPIIAAPAGGTGEYLVDEENALTFPVGDHKAMAAAMKRLMNNRDLQLRLREGGRKTAVEKFDFEKILDLHEHYLLSAAGKATAASSVAESGIGKS